MSYPPLSGGVFIYERRNMSKCEKLQPEAKLFSEIPVNGIFMPCPIGNIGGRQIKIDFTENPQFGQINSLNYEWILQDLIRNKTLTILQIIESISKNSTYGGYVNFIPDDCKCTYLGQVNL